MKINGSYKGQKCKEESTAAERELLNALDDGLNLEAGKMLFSQLLLDWLEDKRAKKLKRRTLENYERFIVKHIIPFLGHLRIKDITPRHIQDFYNHLHEVGVLGWENIGKCHIIKRAFVWGMIKKSPAAVVEKLNC
ncbi:N-terminal phage integrase SAM-like domain-containing protein [Paenibacillus herberti]|uniref:Core-binding (CB) domain-containing protein n=1 Tax=Paenibacillus herberti TaxID=1619309 RepID=A0A229P0L3_9BACL|nr:N-terminal phage integrase SAM-like domain-containing protein [Paenibacillus herberti]OXM15783.1 hypothetical protein CGZ75_03430 [Paenibacillus herberti]